VVAPRQVPLFFSICTFVDGVARGRHKINGSARAVVSALVDDGAKASTVARAAGKSTEPEGTRLFLAGNGLFGVAWGGGWVRPRAEPVLSVQGSSPKGRVR
jgi:hypothetical protein